ncbi:sugar ABC transporter permease [Halobacillus trueperi]|uniref:Raffinose/stachyose/melibiose transport system permease protein n=2 Tax=Halobacillus TaxID=45667 RepID=A0A1H0H1H6_HALAD|nr:MULTISPECIES: sugar ABC transporter permease [Halobacillus]RDY71648.1 sugar ABC transporter permease [Halobacillus trueperi]SDO13116.1 raffinose/stachyose/melibiose transport system permease protein [Halobacillus aidingensis]
MQTLVNKMARSRTMSKSKTKSTNVKFRDALTILLFIAPAFIVYAVYVLYPIFSTFRYSLHAWDGMSEMTFVGFANYIQLFQDAVFWTSLTNNAWVVIVSVFVQIPLGLLMALMLFAPIKGIRFMSSVYFFPFLMSTVAIGLLWVLMYDPINGIINQLVTLLGFESVSWLSQADTAMFAVLLVVVWQFAPFYMILFKAAIVGIPEELYEAAKMDGANALTKFIHITLPMLMPTIVSSSILAIVGSLKAFDIFYIMTGGGPNHGTELMGTYMFKQAFINFNMGYASAIAFLMFFIALVVTIIIQMLDFYRKKRGAYS